MKEYTFTKSCEIGKLEQEIVSTLSTSPLSVTVYGEDDLRIVFPQDLTTDEETLLNDTVAAHIKTPVLSTDITTSVSVHLPDVKTSKSDQFKRISTYLSTGADIASYVRFAGYVDAGCVGELRIFDQTHGVVIGSKTMTNENEEIKETDLLVGWPEEPSIIEFQLRRVSGTGNNSVNITALTILF